MPDDLYNPDFLFCSNTAACSVVSSQPWKINKKNSTYNLKLIFKTLATIINDDNRADDDDDDDNDDDDDDDDDDDSNKDNYDCKRSLIMIILLIQKKCDRCWWLIN